MRKKKKRYKSGIYSVWIDFVSLDCGEGGIRTLGTVSRTTVFETATIDRSATSPVRGGANVGNLGGTGKWEKGFRRAAVGDGLPDQHHLLGVDEGSVYD